MDDLVLIDKVKKAIKTAQDQIEETVMGGVDNMEKYKYLLGQAHAYQIILQEISNLLNKGGKDDKSSVLSFGNTRNKNNNT